MSMFWAVAAGAVAVDDVPRFPFAFVAPTGNPLGSGHPAAFAAVLGVTVGPRSNALR
jgi:hypothetical protein